MKTHWMKLGVTLFALIAGTLYTTAAQQPKERLIRRLPIEQNEPIAITNIKVNDQSVSFDKKFTADDEWLRTLVVSIKNKSDKLILFASIQLQFPRPAGSQDKMSVEDIFYGNWALQRRPPTPEEGFIGIAPGETVEIPLSVQKFLDLRQFLTATGFPQSIDEVDMRVNSVIFEDDSMWTRGTYVRRDQNNPSSWKNVNP
jgi:hypothetical protein